MSKSRDRLFGLSTQAKENLIKQVLKRQSRQKLEDPAVTPDRRGGARRPAPEQIPESFYRFDKLPGYQQLMVQKAAADQIGIDNPFFHQHQAIARSTSVIEGREYINFASYSYLDLNGHPEVSRAAREAIDRYGTSVSASRPVSGERPLHAELEAELAALHGVDAAVAFVSGHATNVTTIGYLFGPKDLVLHDALIHNSVLQGIQLSGAHRISFPHNDWQALDAILNSRRGEFNRVLIVIEGIYSMDGDCPELGRFVEIKRRHKAFLMVDEAHAIGVLGRNGRGLAEEQEIDSREVDIWMGTLSKTLASCGGYIAGSHALVEHLKFSAPGFLYSVGMAPPVAAAALAALRLMRQEPERVARLRRRGSLFLKLARQQGIDTGHSAGYGIVPAVTRSSIVAGRLANALYRRGINVPPIVYPAVEEGAARLRFFLNSSHTEEQIAHTVDVLAEEFAKVV
ncbi:MAG TPA: aminotransferase class I/II-fold pyridoxal phosphate-dependent enzyme [Sedimenticola thiotaurini]|uniref:Aminotransferase class I/II-fold pyridoxal phosphate-dependent enzyme n=1 Tax=Sedimenticola thiotaurini TaxID=1543721 RepID=A0A831RQN5_9GAMM|nr:aminotransferase class I/II-fold pyridoxal phosphate-dependent enzyme [Sedimenticola thiotaurini]